MVLMDLGQLGQEEHLLFTKGAVKRFVAPKNPSGTFIFRSAVCASVLLSYTVYLYIYSLSPEVGKSCPFTHCFLHRSQFGLQWSVLTCVRMCVLKCFLLSQVSKHISHPLYSSTISSPGPQSKPYRDKAAVEWAGHPEAGLGAGFCLRRHCQCCPRCPAVEKDGEGTEPSPGGGSGGDPRPNSSNPLPRKLG